MLESSCIVDAMAGGFAGAFTELIFYSIDSMKVQSQAGSKLDFKRLFRGAVPISFLGSFPSMFVFFGVFSPCKELFSSNGYSSGGVLAASFAAAVPSSIIGIPSDVLKKRVVLGLEPTVRQACTAAIQERGISGLMLGWQTSLIKDVPFAALKLSLYEGMANMYLRHYKKHQLQPHEAAGVGFVSGTITAIMTCPTDCVNTRIKSGELASNSVIGAHFEIARRDGVKALFRGLVPRMAVLSLGSTVFWFWYNHLQKGMDQFSLPHGSLAQT
mmetsp:Transcript_22099/g.32199  ORF Transcript_22099/g.32199 Transcript_22099/m.32199 type:complete len:271 (+) Transcript_22099:135-947(+)